MKVKLKSQDMVELWQLLKMYELTYGSNAASELRTEVALRYTEITGEDISDQTNPRGAGRKRKYTDADKQRIIELKDSGLSIRGIAASTGYSIGYVHSVLSVR